MPNQARDKRQQKEKAEAKRRRAQSQRDKARNRHEEQVRVARIARAVQQQLTRGFQSSSLPAEPPSGYATEAIPKTISQLSITEARSDKFMRESARYASPLGSCALSNLHRMFDDTKYSDATICIDQRAPPVHKFVICTQSSYFEKAFRDAFAEGRSGELTFKDGKGAAYWRVFEYLYAGDYSEDLSAGFEGTLLRVYTHLTCLQLTR